MSLYYTLNQFQRVMALVCSRQARFIQQDLLERQSSLSHFKSVTCKRTSLFRGLLEVAHIMMKILHLFPVSLASECLGWLLDPLEICQGLTELFFAKNGDITQCYTKKKTC